VKKADALQPIDVLINNAGIASETPFLNIPEDEWKNIIDINLTGSFYVAQAVSQRMALRKRGVVINMSSKNGLDGEFGYAHYNASKGGIIMLSKTMALELAHLGIRVNAVCPGYTDTELTDSAVDNIVNALGKTATEARAMLVGIIPRGVMTTPNEVAAAVAWLCAPGSGAITGIALPVAGGEVT